MDVLTTADALALAGKVAEHVDIIELGTPLIKAEGMRAVTAIKEAHPDKIVFADLKTMDAGELEADIAFTAGADLVTVLGTAGDSTIVGAVKAATKHGKGVVVDLIGVAAFTEPNSWRCTPVSTSRRRRASHSTRCSPRVPTPASRSPSPAESASRRSRPFRRRARASPSPEAPSTARPIRPPQLPSFAPRSRSSSRREGWDRDGIPARPSPRPPDTRRPQRRAGGMIAQ
jgi:hypothetical protein